MKKDPNDPTKMIEKEGSDLNFIEKHKVKEKLKLQMKWEEVELETLQGRLFNFVHRRCTELLQDRI